jgi:hypothetical protein
VLADGAQDRRVVGLSPAQAERVACGVGVDLKALRRIDVVGRPKEPGAESHDLGMSADEVLDVHVEVQLLGRAVGPLWRDVVGSELYADDPLPTGPDC